MSNITIADLAQLTKEDLVELLAAALDGESKARGKHAKREAHKVTRTVTAAAKKFHISCVDCGTEVHTNRSNQKRCTACSKANTEAYLTQRKAYLGVREGIAAALDEWTFASKEQRAQVRTLATDMAIKGADPKDAVASAIAELF